MDIYQFLQKHGIEFERHDHPAVYTCAEANELVPDLSGAKTKNLFLRDRRGKRHFLCVVGDEKSVDLKSLAPLIESTPLSMGSADRLKKHLGIEPGSVSLLAVVNDNENSVEVVLDKGMWEADALQCHPLVNTSTLVISHEGIETFLNTTGHTPTIVEIPERSD